VSRHAPLDLNALLLFHGIAASGSLTRAAAQLDVPKATLSRRLRALEREIDALLVTRGRRRLELTEAGAALYAASQQLVSEARAVGDYARTLRAELDGALRVAVPTGYMATLCGRALLRFAALHPRVRLQVFQTDRWIDVTEEPFDIVVRVGAVPNRALPVCPLARIRRGAYASPQYLKSRAAPAQPADLAQHECVIVASQLAAGVWPALERRGRPAPPRAIVSDVYLARDMALAGLGITVLPEALCREDLAAGRLVRLLLDWRIPPADVVATYADQRHLPAKLRSFLDLLRAEFAALHGS